MTCRKNKLYFNLISTRTWSQFTKTDGPGFLVTSCLLLPNFGILSRLSPLWGLSSTSKQYSRYSFSICLSKCYALKKNGTTNTISHLSSLNIGRQKLAISLTNTYFNFTFDKRRLKNFVSWALLNYGEHKTIALLEELKKTGFEYATKAGISLGIDDLKIPPKKTALIFEAEKQTTVTINQFNRGEITGVERFQRLIDTWHRTSELLKQEVIDHFEATDILNPVYMMAFSGARGNVSQVRQLVGMRGLMADPQGQIIDFPIRSNFREGLTLTEYVISSYGARKGIVDTALRTATAGYLTRRLVDVAQHVIVSLHDCGTKRGIVLTDMKEGSKIISSIQNRLIGRVLARDLYIKGLDGTRSVPSSRLAKRNQEISSDLAFEISKITNKVFVRSALTCQTKKLVCQLCYGWSLTQGNLVSLGEAVGIIAAQSIGEPGTQLTMRTFHTGGVFSGDVSETIRAPYNGVVQYSEAIPGTLIRTPEGKIAFLTKREGTLLVLASSLCPEGTTSGIDNCLSLSIEDRQKIDNINRFKIPAFTVLFIRHGENVNEKQVMAQVSSISRQKNIRDDAELVIKSEMEGEFYGKELNLAGKLVGPRHPQKELSTEDENIYDSWKNLIIAANNWSYAWILSGNIYQLPMPASFFPKSGDFLNRQSVMSQVEWMTPFSPQRGLTGRFHLGLGKLHSNLELGKLHSNLGLGKLHSNNGGSISFLEKKSNFNSIVYCVNKLSAQHLDSEKLKTILDQEDVTINAKKQALFLDIQKIKYNKLGYFLSPVFVYHVNNLLSLTRGRSLPLSLKFKNSIKLPSNFYGEDKGLLSQSDLIFVPNSLAQKKLENALSSTTWSPTLNYLLQWFPKKSNLKTSGILFNERSLQGFWKGLSYSLSMGNSVEDRHKKDVELPGQNMPYPLPYWFYKTPSWKIFLSAQHLMVHEVYQVEDRQWFYYEIYDVSSKELLNNMHKSDKVYQIISLFCEPDKVFLQKDLEANTKKTYCLSSIDIIKHIVSKKTSLKTDLLTQFKTGYLLAPFTNINYKKNSFNAVSAKNLSDDIASNIYGLSFRHNIPSFDLFYPTNPPKSSYWSHRRSYSKEYKSILTQWKNPYKLEWNLAKYPNFRHFWVPQEIYKNLWSLKSNFYGSLICFRIRSLPIVPTQFAKGQQHRQNNQENVSICLPRKQLTNKLTGFVKTQFFSCLRSKQKGKNLSGIALTYAILLHFKHYEIIYSYFKRYNKMEILNMPFKKYCQSNYYLMSIWPDRHKSNYLPFLFFSKKALIFVLKDLLLKDFTKPKNLLSRAKAFAPGVSRSIFLSAQHLVKDRQRKSKFLHISENLFNKKVSGRFGTLRKCNVVNKCLSSMSIPDRHNQIDTGKQNSERQFYQRQFYHKNQTYLKEFYKQKILKKFFIKPFWSNYLGHSKWYTKCTNTNRIKTDAIAVQIKTGWVYKTNNLAEALKYNGVLIFPGKKIMDDFIFDSHITYLECMPLSEMSIPDRQIQDKGITKNWSTWLKNKKPRFFVDFIVDFRAVPSNLQKAILPPELAKGLALKKKSMSIHWMPQIFIEEVCQIDNSNTTIKNGHDSFLILIQKVKEYQSLAPKEAKTDIYSMTNQSSFLLSAKGLSYVSGLVNSTRALSLKSRFFTKFKNMPFGSTYANWETPDAKNLPTTKKYMAQWNYVCLSSMKSTLTESAKSTIDNKWNYVNINYSFDSLLLKNKYHSNTFNKQKRDLNPLSKIPNIDINIKPNFSFDSELKNAKKRLIRQKDLKNAALLNNKHALNDFSGVKHTTWLQDQNNSPTGFYLNKLLAQKPINLNALLISHMIPSAFDFNFKTPTVSFNYGQNNTKYNKNVVKKMLTNLIYAAQKENFIEDRLSPSTKCSPCANLKGKRYPNPKGLRLPFRLALGLGRSPYQHKGLAQPPLGAKLCQGINKGLALANKRLFCNPCYNLTFNTKIMPSFKFSFNENSLGYPLGKWHIKNRLGKNIFSAKGDSTNILTKTQYYANSENPIAKTSYFSAFEGEFLNRSKNVGRFGSCRTNKANFNGPTPYYLRNICLSNMTNAPKSYSDLILTKQDLISLAIKPSSEITDYKKTSNQLGIFFVSGDQIHTLSQIAFKKSGQIVHMNSEKITLRRAQPIFISPKGIFHVSHRHFVDAKAPVITLSYQRLKTGDIVQGIPKIEQFFEARTTKNGRLFRDSLSNLLYALFKRYKILAQEYKPSDLDTKPTNIEKNKKPWLGQQKWIVRQSFYKIQQIIVDGVQRVYKSQGVTISDKHIEIIVKQMTSKVKIIKAGQTGFFPGELVDLDLVEQMNSFMLVKIQYKPIVLGISRSSLEVKSFLSAASFQQTTKILSKSAISKRQDYLKGLKENILVGNLIPAGTGYMVSLAKNNFKPSV